MKNTDGTTTKQIVWIDFLRMVACFLVIVNHTNSRIFVETTPSFEWFISLTYFFVSKVAVPIFLMISGYLLLDKEDSYRKMLSRLGKTLGALVLFSAIYYYYYIRLGKSIPHSISGFLLAIVKEPISGSFWYLYMYMGMLIMLPFLQKLVKNMKKNDFHIFFAISFVVYGGWPIVVHYIPEMKLTEEFDIPLLGSYICILLLGYYIKLYCNTAKKLKTISAIIFMIAITFNVVVTFLEYTYVSQAKEKYLFLDDRTFLPIVLAAACLFYCVRDITFSNKLGNIISTIGPCSFGIYLLSDLLISNFQFVFEFFDRYIPSLLAVLIQEIWIFGVGFLITYLLRKTPGIRKIL